MITKNFYKLLISIILVVTMLAMTAGPVLADDPPAPFVGVLQTVTDTVWTVEGTNFAVNETTVKPAFYAIGDSVEVTYVVDAALGNLATQVRVLDSGSGNTFTYQGVLTAFTGSEWNVDAYTFNISSVTLPPYFAAQDIVEVTFIIVGGNYVATAVKVVETHVPPKTESNRCENRTKEHPGALKLAVRIGEDAEQVEAFFCLGFGLGEVKQAYRSAEGSEYTPAMLLALRSSGMGWGEVKKIADLKPIAGEVSEHGNKPDEKSNNGKAVGQGGEKSNNGKAVGQGGEKSNNGKKK